MASITSFRVGLVCSVLAAVVVPAQTGAAPAPAAPAPTSVAIGGQPAWAVATADQGRVADLPIHHLTVVLARAPASQRAFDALRVAQDTLGSPDYHRWLTPQQIGARFGAGDAQLAAVTSWLAAAHLAVVRVGAARTMIEIRGTTRDVEAAFGIELHRYRVGAAMLRAPDRRPTVPAELAGIVAGVTGLAETVSAPQHVVRVPARAGSPDFVSNDGEHFVGVADFVTIYDLAPVYAQHLDGRGVTIAILGRSRVFAPDIANFGTVQATTLAPVKTVIPPDGVDPGSACGDPSCGSDAGIDDQGEATLDVERVTSIAFRANVDLVVSATDQQGDDGVAIALEFAVDDFGSATNANIITISFGLCEQLETSTGITFIDTLYQQAAAQGQSVFVSAGDSGAAGCDVSFDPPPATQTLGVNALCTSPASTCVGGTEFDDPDAATYWGSGGSALSYIPEGAWNDPLAGSATRIASTGGGISIAVALPSYQDAVAASLGSAVGSAFRLVPDVSLNAAIHDPYLVCLAALNGPCTETSGGFTFQAFAGTSAAAPSLAAIMALVLEHEGEVQGAVNAGFYALAAGSNAGVFHDVTVASSGVSSCITATPSMCNNSTPGPTELTGGQAGFAVGSGYDLATGLGSVDAAMLVASWPNQGEVSVAVSPGSASVVAGGSATLAVEVTGFLPNPALSCAGLPAAATCAFDGSGSGIALTVSTTAAAGSNAVAAGRLDPWSMLGLFAIGLAALLAASRRARRGHRPRVLAAALLAMAGAAATASCNSSHGDAHVDAAPDAAVTVPGNYTVTVSSTLGLATASTTFDLTITP